MTKQEREELRRLCSVRRRGVMVHTQMIIRLLDALDAQDERIKELEGRLAVADRRRENAIASIALVGIRKP